MFDESAVDESAVDETAVNEIVSFFVPIHRSYFCVRLTDGAARILFFLSLSLPERVTLWLRIIPMHVREREERRKKEEEKSPEKNTSP